MDHNILDFENEKETVVEGLNKKRGWLLGIESVALAILFPIPALGNSELLPLVPIVFVLLLFSVFVGFFLKLGLRHFMLHLLANASILVLGMGFFFKIQSWPFASDLLLLGCWTWVGVQFAEFWRYANTAQWPVMWKAQTASAVSVSVAFIGWLNKIQWNRFNASAFLGLGIVLVLAYVWRAAQKDANAYFLFPRLLAALYIISPFSPLFDIKPQLLNSLWGG